MCDDLNFQNLTAEIASVPTETADHVDDQLRFIQEAFRRLERRLADLPVRDRKVIQVVLCNRIKRVLCHIHLHVEGTMASQKVLHAERMDQVREATATFDVAGRELAEFYGLHR